MKLKPLSLIYTSTLYSFHLQLLQSERDALEESRREVGEAAKDAEMVKRDSEKRMEAEKSVSEHNINVIKRKHDRSMRQVNKKNDNKIKSAVRMKTAAHNKEMKWLKDEHTKEVARMQMKIDMARRDTIHHERISAHRDEEISLLKDTINNSSECLATHNPVPADREVEILKRKAAEMEDRHQAETEKLREEKAALRKELRQLKRQKTVADNWSDNRLQRANMYRDKAEHLREEMTSLNEER